VNRIKRLSFEAMEDHKSKFGEDFAENKKVLNEISIVRSKSLKNEITGYITRLIKKENREEKIKQDRRLASQPEEQEVKVETPEVTTSEETVESTNVSDESSSESETAEITIPAAEQTVVSDESPKSTEEKTE
jgi:small subunit ribosomal protein S17e